MDDALIVVIALIAIIGSVIKNAKKAAKKRPGQAQKPQAAPAKGAGQKPPGKAMNWEEAFPPELREVLAKERGKAPAKKYTLKNAPKAAPASAAKPGAEGASPVFADGCVGGSMPHGLDPEGKSVAYADGCVGGSLPHDDRPPRQRATLREQTPDTRPVLLDATSHVRSQPKLSAAEMRRAVITAEVLSRPVALRPHGYRL